MRILSLLLSIFGLVPCVFGFEDGSPIRDDSFYVLQTYSLLDEVVVASLNAHYFNYAVFEAVNVNNGTRTSAFMRYVHTGDADESRFIVSEFDTYLTGSSVAEDGKRVSFEDRHDSELEYQKWLIVYVGEGGYEILNKVTKKSLGFYFDRTPALREPNLIASYNTSNARTKFRLHGLERNPTTSILLNQNTYHPLQQKNICYLDDTLFGTPQVSYTVSGPVTWRGSMTGGVFLGNQYFCDSFPEITTQGMYIVNVNGNVKEFFVSDTAFLSKRAEHGGVLTWRSFIDGYLKFQTVDPETLKVGIMGPEGIEIGDETFELKGGIYDGSIRESLLSIGIDVYEFLSAAVLVTNNTQNRDDTKAVLKEAVDWYIEVQNTDGSFPLGKRVFNRTITYWSVDIEPGAVAKIGSGLAAISEVFNDDTVYRNSILEVCEKAWNFVNQNLTAEAYMFANEQHGTYYDVITFATELYIATGEQQYADFANDHITHAIVEPTVGAYISDKIDNPKWPYKLMSGYSFTDFSTFWYSFARYYQKITDQSIKDKMLSQMTEAITIWESGDFAPMGFPTFQLFPYSVQGWGGPAMISTATLLKLYEVTGDENLKTRAANVWDFAVGANPFGSNLLVGGRGESKVPLNHIPWNKATGAVVPGSGLIVDSDGSRRWELNETISTFSEADTRYSSALIYATEVLGGFYPVNLFGDHIPEPVSQRIYLRDQALDTYFEIDMRPYIFDYDDDYLRCVKGIYAEGEEAQNNSWWEISCDCVLTGTPTIAQNKQWQLLSIQVDDRILAPQQFNASFYVFPENFNLFTP